VPLVPVELAGVDSVGLHRVEVVEVIVHARREILDTVGDTAAGSLRQ
jgi:hypothetical protein